MKEGKLLRCVLICTSALAVTPSIRAAVMMPQAGDRSMELATGWYAAANVRANLIEDAHLRQIGGAGGGHVTFDPGAGFGIRGGYRFCQYFSLEGETGFTGNSIDRMANVNNVEADLLQVPFMANAVFSFPIQYALAPFFGAGIGGTTSVLDVDHINIGNAFVTGTESTTTFSYQFFAGVHYAINDQISVGLIYNYRAVDGPRWDRGGFPIEFGDLRNHSIGLSANFRF